MLMRHNRKIFKYNLDTKLQNQWTCYEGNETYIGGELMTWKIEINKLSRIYTGKQKRQA